MQSVLGRKKTPDSVVLITGDFNHCVMNHLPNFYQYIDCHTRNDTTIDLCYGNVEAAYNSTAHAGLGKSDHNIIHMIPKYRSKLKTIKPTKKIVTIWTNENIEHLQHEFESTDWDMFIDSCLDLDELNDTVTDYINFCEDKVSQKHRKEVVCYPNSKPWVTKELKEAILAKNNAFRTGDKATYMQEILKVKSKIKEAKQRYKRKLEQNISSNSKFLWDSMKKMAGCINKKTTFSVNDDERDYANKLNNFYARFDVNDFSDEARKRVEEIMKESVDENDFIICEDQVRMTFRNLNVRKACGPDGMKGFVLKSFQINYVIFSQRYLIYL